MTELYYKDSLAAAYMAREFDVKLELYNIECFQGKDWMCIEDIVDTLNAPFKGFETFYVKFYVKPESHAIFEPQVGDLLRVYFKEKSRCCWFEGAQDKRCQLHGEYIGKQWLLSPKSHGCVDVVSAGAIKNFEIIQRNNKPFFMPEVEHD